MRRSQADERTATISIPSSREIENSWTLWCVPAAVSTLILAAFFYYWPNDPKDARVELARESVLVAMVFGAFCTGVPFLLCLGANELRKYLRWSAWFTCPLMAAIALIFACVIAAIPGATAGFDSWYASAGYGFGLLFGPSVPFGLVFSLLLARRLRRSGEVLV